MRRPTAPAEPAVLERLAAAELDKDGPAIFAEGVGYAGIAVTPLPELFDPDLRGGPETFRRPPLVPLSECERSLLLKDGSS